MNKTDLTIQRPKIEIGYRIGKLTVQERTPLYRHRYSVWKCCCDCGGEILLDTRQLQRATVRDCGCSGIKVKSGQKDLTGQRFGKLICLEPTNERGSSGGTVWRCRCDCGNECLAISTQLTQGYKKSCGCLSHPPLKDYVGKQFGSLVVMEYAGKRSGLHYWHCKCECGVEIDVGQTRLQSGQITNCGCKRYLARKQLSGEQKRRLALISSAGIQDYKPDGTNSDVSQSDLRSKPRELVDLTGRIFGRLTVIGFAEWKDDIGYWRCQCECGNQTTVRHGNLLYGHTKSCGCLQREVYQKNMQFVGGTSVRLIERRMESTIKSNTSGHNGVYLNGNGMWTAQITFKGKTYYLGSYSDIQDAVKARKRGEEMYERFLDWYYNGYSNVGDVAEGNKKE
ncbi:MAG: hypothetical protein J1E60_00410 [Christensenellaceae bacterium]|nr:hypothetical protein [Christensenellaceae bacterium]